MLAPPSPHCVPVLQSHHNFTMFFVEISQDVKEGISGEQSEPLPSICSTSCNFVIKYLYGIFTTAVSFQLWDIRKKAAVQTFQNTYQVLAVTFNDTSDQIISGGIDNDIKV